MRQLKITKSITNRESASIAPYIIYNCGEAATRALNLEP